MKGKRNIMESAGTLDMNDEEAEEIKLKIEKLGKHSTKDLLRK